MQPHALDDLTIIDLTRVLAGPYCTQLLADYGANVIKVEQPGSGDGTRQWGPPWQGGESAYFLSVNRNKRSLTLNLKSAEGLAILKQLLTDADVLIENFRPGTLARLGLDPDTLTNLNPRLIVCSISGYGQTGPDRDRPGYDFMIQAQGGLMSITGPADGEPHKVGVAIVDITAGLFAANAILTALHHREKSGVGQQIDVALLDTQLAWLANVAHNYFASAEIPPRFGNAHPNIVPYQSFATADGTLALAVGTDAQYKRLCDVVGAPELWQDARFQTNPGRVAHRDKLVARLQTLFKTRTSAEWMRELVEAAIPASPVNDIPTALADPQAQHREMVQRVAHPTAGDIDLLGPVAKLSATPAEIRSAPPLLGANSAEILAEIGYSEIEIERLQADGII